MLKLPRSQRGFSLADLLGRHGYHSRFIYGGESHFDNMKGFFLGNGFKQVVDRADFVDPAFVGTWGASDEDMFNQLDRLLRADSDQPTFTLAFSVSNHSPWEYPAGRIQVDGNPATVENTVRYADWALGRFFERAKASPYWENTVFLVAADHDSRVFGASLVPVRHFHIPAVILGAGIEPRRDERLISQIDLAPTLLSLTGVDTEHPMIGHDLTRSTPGRAIMQYDNTYGYLKEDRLLVMAPSKTPVQYRYRPEDYTPEALDPELGARGTGARAVAELGLPRRPLCPARPGRAREPGLISRSARTRELPPRAFRGGMAMAAGVMVVDHAHGLHEGIDRGRPTNFQPSFLSALERACDCSDTDAPRLDGALRGAS